MTLIFPSLETCTVAVIGLGYVGLPLAVEFAKPYSCAEGGTSFKRRVIGFDINNHRLGDLRRGIDSTQEISSEELYAAQSLEFTNDPGKLAEADVFLVTVPTPIDSVNRPNLLPLEKATATVGRALKQRHSDATPIVIFESTVYPGATEESCVPILERESNLLCNYGFCCGYSPERINPGDNQRKLTEIVKVTSGSTHDAAIWIDNFYRSVIAAGTHLAPSLKVAEAAKVIENTQRDLNIALVNELAIIFRRMGIDTLDVLEAAGTKWNFLPFRPGLVGGHCIGVDPYYLTHKAEELGYQPQVVLAGRRINDGMGFWFAEQLVLELAKRRQAVVDTKVLVLGFSFKENCPDFRNTKVMDLIQGLERYAIEVVVVDPWVDPEQALAEYGVKVLSAVPNDCCYGAIAVAVAHSEFIELTSKQWKSLLAPFGVFLDIKGIVPRELEPVRP